MSKGISKAGKVGTSTVKRVLEDEFGVDFDPLIELLRLGRSTESDQVAAKCYAEACKYVHPSLKSVEVNKKVLHGVYMADSELANRFRQFISEKNKTNEEPAVIEHLPAKTANG